MLGDIRKLVHDAWEFFSPPLIRLAIAIMIFWYLCGAAPLQRASTFVVGKIMLLNLPAITDVLEKFKLTPLVPVIALFLISVAAYSINRLISGVGIVLPFTLTSVPADTTKQMIYSDPRWREYMAQRRIYNADTIIDYLIAKARYEKQEPLVSGLDSWQRDVGRAYGTFFFAKFLLAWTFGCAVLSGILPDTPPVRYGRLLIIILLISVYALFSACQYAFASQQLAYSRVRIARVMLDAATDPKSNERENEDERAQFQKYYQQVGEQNSRGWWSVRASLTDRWEMLKYYDFWPRTYPRYPDRLWLQAILQNSANLIWFLIAGLLILFLARVSWWLGCGLFIGYLTVTFIESFTVFAIAVATFGQAVLVRLKPRVPNDVSRLFPDQFWKGLAVRDKEQFWLTAAAMLILEALIAIGFCRALADYLF